AGGARERPAHQGGCRTRRRRRSGRAPRGRPGPAGPADRRADPDRSRSGEAGGRRRRHPGQGARAAVRLTVTVPPVEPASDHRGPVRVAGPLHSQSSWRRLQAGGGAAWSLGGLVQVVAPEDITVVVNTGDDDWFHRLFVCPDLDTVTYTLAGAENPDTGWGLAGETFAAIDALERYGSSTWFRLGDRDLATHLDRPEPLKRRAALSTIAAEIAHAWAIRPRLLPMSDDPVSTRIEVRWADGSVEELHMQEWFVRERAEPPVVAVRFDGVDRAAPAPGVLEAIDEADTVVVCPSNPV